MLKVQRSFSTIAPAVSGYYIAGQNEIISLLHLALAVFFIHMSSNVINDIADYEADKINEPNRVLVTGIISRKQAIVLSLSLLLIGLIFTLTLDWLLFVVAATLGIFSLISYNYGLKLKDQPFGSIIYLSLGSSTIPFLGGFIIMRNLNMMSVVFALFLTIFTCSFIINSLRDIQGDMIAKKRTLAVMLGKEKSKLFSILLVFLPFLAYPIISPIFGFLQIYLIYAIIPISIRLTISFFLSKSDFTTPRYLMRFLVIADFTILALSKPENNQFWLQL